MNIDRFEGIMEAHISTWEAVMNARKLDLEAVEDSYEKGLIEGSIVTIRMVLDDLRKALEREKERARERAKA